MQTLQEISYSIRQFGAEDVVAYKAMRLEALKTEPGMFGSSYAMEAAFIEADWIKRVSSENNAVFGLYCGDDLIGITGAVIDAERTGEAYMT